MGKIFLYLLLFLLGVTIISFILGYHIFAYSVGSILGTAAIGVSFVYSARDDDRFRPNYLNNNIGDKKK
ncbi:hypothetical protein RCG24_17520 [Neobacillus sp. OS1-32]|jgi:hypothetical protein|uniref:DUF2273 domain-containing protein n=1 Tax=Neobacillus paridis TaxID=2803862 RepID=A0ABS1TR35_9BACI|nr:MULTISPECIES: hypothetical protein [Neobacillus]MBL4953219.1 hypothetical protein [Neobacillus paridis]WML29697.1 hypothetical protein RCG24_17520 [Neobacillus sp. OS1-32]